MGTYLPRVPRLGTHVSDNYVDPSLSQVFVCVNFEADRECYEVDPTQTRSEVPLTIPEHILKLPRDYEASAFLATQESDPTQFLPVGIETGPMLLAVEPKLCVVVPFRDGCHGRQQGRGRAHNKQVRAGADDISGM